MITAKGLSKSFGPNIVLQDLDLNVERGEFLTIFGPNGAGKTTLIKILATLVSPTSGTARIAGYDIKREPEKIRGRIGVISHDTYLYHDLTAWENLGFYGRMYRVEDLDARIGDVLEEVGLKYRYNDRVGTFSRGMKQRLSIARAIIHDPDILFLDEPYTGLDQHAIETFDSILRDLDLEEKTMVMASHDVEQGLKVCDRVAILNDGRIAYSIPRDEIRDAGEFRDTYREVVQG